MAKYVNAERLKKRVLEEVNKDGTKFGEAMGHFFCAVIDDMQGVELIKPKRKPPAGYKFDEGGRLIRDEEIYEKVQRRLKEDARGV